MEGVKKCGNCGHLINERLKNEQIYLGELYAGKCEMNGKKMLGSLVAGCPYWADRKNRSYGDEKER